MRKLLVLGISLALIVLIATGCQSSKSSDKTNSAIDPPISHLTWGATFEEVHEMLKGIGITDIANAPNGNVSTSLKLTVEQMDAMGVQEVAGMPLSTELESPVELQFLADKDGVFRLSMMYVSVALPTEETRLSLMASKELVATMLTPIYGAQDDESKAWGTSGRKLTQDEAENLNANERTLLEAEDYDAFYIYPRVTAEITGMNNLEATLMYDAGSYVHLLFGNF